MSEERAPARKIVLNGRIAGAVYIVCWFMTVSLDHWGPNDYFTRLMIYRLLPLGAVLGGTAVLSRKESPSPFASLGIAGLMWTGCIVFYSLVADQTVYARYGFSGSPNFWYYMVVHMGGRLLPQLILSALGIPVFRKVKAWAAAGGWKRFPRRVIIRGLAAGVVYALAWALSNHWFFHHSRGSFSVVAWYALAASLLSWVILYCRDRREWGKGFCCAAVVAGLICYAPFFFNSEPLMRFLFAWHPSTDTLGEYSARGWDTVALICLGAPILTCVIDLVFEIASRKRFSWEEALAPSSLSPSMAVFCKGLSAGAVYGASSVLIAKIICSWSYLGSINRFSRLSNLCTAVAIVLGCLIFHWNRSNRWVVSLLLSAALAELIFGLYTFLAYFAGDIADSPASGIGIYLVQRYFLRMVLGTAVVMLLSGGTRALISARSKDRSTGGDEKEAQS